VDSAYSRRLEELIAGTLIRFLAGSLVEHSSALVSCMLDIRLFSEAAVGRAYEGRVLVDDLDCGAMVTLIGHGLVLESDD
jgi:hypothetical protein